MSGISARWAQVLILGLALLPCNSFAVDINPYYDSGVQQEQRTLINSAIGEMEGLFAGPTNFQLNIKDSTLASWPSVPGRTYILTPEGIVLAFTDQFNPQGVNLCPVSARIVFNLGVAFHWGLGLPGPTTYDGLTVTRHEILHAIGFAIYYKNYADRVNAPALTFNCSGGPVSLSAGDNNGLSHVSAAAYPGDLMTPTLAAGERRGVSALDRAMILCAFAECYSYGRASALSERGLLVLVLLLAGTAIWVLRRRRAGLTA